MIKTMKDHKAMILAVVAVYFAVFMFCTANVQAADTSAYASIFNAEYYASANADVKAVYGTDANALFNHFVNYGMKEGRRASAEFDVKYYRANNADLNAAFGDNLTLYYMHYMNYGKAEGRKGAGNATTTSQTTQATQQSQTTQATQTTASGYKNVSAEVVTFVNDLNAFRVAHGKNALILLDVNGFAWDDAYWADLEANPALADTDEYYWENMYFLKRANREFRLGFKQCYYVWFYNFTITHKEEIFERNTQDDVWSMFLDEGNYIIPVVGYNDAGDGGQLYIFK